MTTRHLFEQYSGEEKLALAVLVSACEDLDSKNPRVQDRAIAYFLAEERDWPFAFSVLCDYFHFERISPEKIRAAVAQKKKGAR